MNLQHTDYDRVLTLGYPLGLQKEGERCLSCKEQSIQRECDDCGRSGYVIDCGHYAQPRPLSTSLYGGIFDVTCEDCEEKRREGKG